jgi:hypothetical protein
MTYNTAEIHPFVLPADLVIISISGPDDGMKVWEPSITKLACEEGAAPAHALRPLNYPFLDT